MVRPFIPPLSRLARRTVKTDAISRLQLDINAAHNADQQVPREPAEALTKSPAALRGEALRGDVQLPRELQAAVDQAIEDGDDKPALRINALDLYAHLRATSAIAPPPSSFRDRQALSTTYDAPTSLAFLAGLMPSMYGATLHALDMTKDRLELLGTGWEPEKMIDWGSGTGSAAWAFREVWGGEGRTYVGLDASVSMIELSSKIVGAIPKGGVGEKMDARSFQLPIPASTSAMAKLRIGPTSNVVGETGGQRTLGITAFSLGDLGTRERRKDLIRSMWESEAEVLVIVERGTPAGARMIAEAREQLLGYGRRSLEWADEDQGGKNPGCFVLAPCPHDGACPLHNDTKSYCHFSQRVRNPAFLRHTKHTTRGEDDAKFSYLVIRRGTRPVGGLAPSIKTRKLPPGVQALLDEIDAEEAITAPSEETEVVPILASTKEGIELSWPRLVAPPLKRSGHIILEVCTTSGLLERHTIPKSQGRQEYYDARKVAWGDSFPHPPKNGPMLAPASLEKVVQKDKYGTGHSKVKSKKAERLFTYKEEQPGRRQRGVKGEKKLGGGETGRDGEVQDYELELGEDGQLKIVN